MKSKKANASAEERYATLVGRIDEAVTILEDMAERREFDWFHVLRVTELLKSALLEAEERYIAGEEPPPRLTVLPGPAVRP